MARRAYFFGPDCDSRYRAFLLSGQSFRARHPISLEFLDGSRATVAAGDSLSTLGRVGELGFRRASFYFLSAAFLDAWRGVRFASALEDGFRRDGLDVACCGRHVDVDARSRMAAGSRVDCSGRI